MKQRTHTLPAAMLLACIVTVAHAQDASSCGSFANNYGPFDYRKANKQQLSIVENAHFMPIIENLLPGRSNPWADDISYTLRVFPNHHRALVTIQNLADRERTDQPKHAQWSVACYFERAVRFQPDDGIVRMLFAGYLIKRAKTEEATRQLEEALRLGADNPFTHFNVGLLFMDMKNHERALTQAHKAMALGLSRPELKERLKEAGKWVEPTSEPASLGTIKAAP